MQLDPQLIRRYGGEGPRYTSYPTAMQFHEALAPNAYEMAIGNNPGVRSNDPLSAYVHIPFCASLCLYCACNKIVTQRMARIDSYVERLLKEIALRGAYFGRARLIDQLHFGGGTPSYLPVKSLEAIVSALDEHLGLTWDDSRDYSIEIDPRGIDRAKLRLLSGLGFNRISFGVQDFDRTVQIAINRVQPYELVEAVYNNARRVGFKSINLDLIYGFPKQTTNTFTGTLRRVIDLRPDRLAIYGYAHMPSMFKAQKLIASSDLPNAGERVGLLQLAIQMLTAAGYVYIGMDHFALPNDGLSIARQAGTLHRSFQGYTTHARRDLVALGVSAIGHIGDLYLQNQKTLKEYNAALDRGALPAQRGVHCSASDLVRGAIIQQIMCRGFIDLRDIEARFHLVFRQYFATEMDRLHGMAVDGLVELSESCVTLTPIGRLLMRNVAMVFDEHLAARNQQLPLSRVV
ncbi:MAG TPA: oxygen-independent coproporphyrinogen III oxidase [Steroidobacteraceae bacterium]